VRLLDDQEYLLHIFRSWRTVNVERPHQTSSRSYLMQIAGYLDTDPMGESTKQKPLNLRVILREHQVVLDGKVLTDQDVQWIERMLTAMFSR
jgi:hypothetical protein